MKRVAPILLFLAMIALQAGPAYSEGSEAVIPILRFDEKSLEAWKQHKFEGETVYTSVTIDGRPAVKAVSNGAASAFYREMKVDIQKYPVLSWSWKVTAAPENPDELKKPGDDYAARVYVAIKTGFLPWQLTVLNYVWSMNTGGPDTWISPYSDKVVMKAMNRGSADLGKWVTHRVNVAEDLKAAFGEDMDEIDGIAVMTDMDNTGKSATAYYGEVSFSSE